MSLISDLRRFSEAWPAVRRRLELAAWRKMITPNLDTSVVVEEGQSFVYHSFCGEQFATLDNLPPKEQQRCRIVHRMWLEAAVQRDPDVARIIETVADTVQDRRVENMDLAGLMGAMRKWPNTEERERCWTAFFQTDATLAALLNDLVDRRNRRSQDLGFTNFFSLRLYADDLKEEEIDRACEQVISHTSFLDDTIDTWKNHAGVSTWTPWNSPFARASASSIASHGRWAADRMLPSCRAFLERHGYQWPEGLTVSTVPMAIGGALHLLSIPDDLRLVIHPSAGFGNWYRFLHELGHALHFSGIQVTDPLMQDETSGALVEGYAQWVGSLARTPDFLVEAGGLSPERAVSYAADLEIHEAWGMRVTVALMRFEQRLYEGVNAECAWTEVMADILNYESCIASEWMWDPMLAMHPVYYQNYVVADILAEYFGTYFHDQFGSLLDSRIPNWLQENFFVSGCTVGWRDKVRQHLGKAI